MLEIKNFSFTTRIPKGNHEFEIEVDFSQFTQENLEQVIKAQVGIDCRAVMNQWNDKGVLLPTKVTFGGDRSKIRQHVTPEALASEITRNMSKEQLEALLAAAQAKMSSKV